MASNSIHLTDFHEAVKATLEANVDWLQSVDYYPEVQTQLPAPCAFFSVADWEFSDRQPMNGQLAVDLNCELLVVFGIADLAYQLKVRNAAMALCLEVSENRWGLPVEGAKLQSAQPDAFSSELDGYAVWNIRWLQSIEVGADAFDGVGITPTQVMVGYSPYIGTGNESMYTEVTDGSPLPGE
ncbi:MAG: hypothetical protein ACPGF7_13710 [Pontibacterium sp.]